MSIRHSRLPRDPRRRICVLLSAAGGEAKRDGDRGERLCEALVICREDVGRGRVCSSQRSRLPGLGRRGPGTKSPARAFICRVIGWFTSTSSIMTSTRSLRARSKTRLLLVRKSSCVAAVRSHDPDAARSGQTATADPGMCVGDLFAVRRPNRRGIPRALC